MKATDLIDELQSLIAQHGDLEVTLNIMDARMIRVTDIKLTTLDNLQGTTMEFSIEEDLE